MKKILIDCLSGFFRTAVVENGELVELIIEEKNKGFSVGSIYTGVVKKILPSQFAFIDIGNSRNTFLHLTDNKEKCIYKYNEITKKNELQIKCGQEIVVQIIKEGTDEKCPTVSSMLTFSGKYIVLLFNDKGINISKKIENEAERKKLSEIGEKIISDVPYELGVIMRTNCVGIDENIIIDEAKTLIQTYDDVIERGKFLKAPAEIYKSDSETSKSIRDLIKNETDEVIINEISEYNKFVNEYDGIGKVTYYNEPVPMFENYFVEKQVEKALHNKIWLKCGGFLIFDYAEACVVIDVNTGKNSKKNHNETVLKTNMEAAVEIAKQIRLKNLSGMIIIDFIDMKLASDRKKVKEALENEVKKDRVGVTVVGMTELGLMQITRKKVRQPIFKMLTCQCPACAGNGFVYNELYIADKIKNEICSIFSSTIYNTVVLSSNQKVINAFKGKNDDYKSIEEKYSGKIEFKTITTAKLDYYEIEKIKKG